MKPALIDRDTIVAHARRYLDTPFRHQGRMRGAGVDCAGLITCVAYDLHWKDVRIDGYGRQPHEPAFRAALREHLDPIGYPELQPGDIVTFAVPVEQHLAIVSSVDPVTIIHAWEKAGRVVEHPLDATWMRRLRGCYRLREAAPMLPAL